MSFLRQQQGDILSTTPSDEDLMEAYQRGEHEAFERLLYRYKNEIYNYIFRFLGEEGDTEEAFQEVFFRVIRSASSYTPQATFSTWLYTIARNYCIDLFRKKKWRKTLSLDEPASANHPEGMTLGDKTVDKNPLPDEKANFVDLQTKLAKSLQAINPDQREVFLLREKAGLRFEEIAEIVGVSVNTVKSRMRYAQTSLRNELKKWGMTDLK